MKHPVNPENVTMFYLEEIDRKNKSDGGESEKYRRMYKRRIKVKPGGDIHPELTLDKLSNPPDRRGVLSSRYIFTVILETPYKLN